MKVYGVAQHFIVGPDRVACETRAARGQKFIVLVDPGGFRAAGRLWQAGAVPSPKKFIVNWHWRRKFAPAVFRSYRCAAEAIKVWWRLVHRTHSRR